MVKHLSVWKIVGRRPFDSDEDAWAPPTVVVDDITGKGSLYYKGQISSCTFEECRDLEVASAWDRHHVVDMLMGYEYGLEVRSGKPQLVEGV